MKMKHNKKRNTAFIFEVLIRELTKSIVEQNQDKKKLILRMIKENFKGNTLLAKDLEIYKMILETREVERLIAEKMVFEAKILKSSINHKKLFEEQGELIENINKHLDPEVFNNFVPNYKDLATVFQIFHPKTKAKQRILLESQMVGKMLSEEEREKELLKPIDNLTYKTFVKKFNEKYNDSLLSEQKNLLKTYIGSFSDNGIELKVFLSDELPRLREALKNSLEIQEVNEDQSMKEGTEKVLNMIEGMKKRHIDNTFIHDVLKIQNLVREIES